MHTRNFYLRAACPLAGSAIISIVVAAVASNAAAPNGGANDPRLAATRYLLSRMKPLRSTCSRRQTP
jgi:hypothetical protein